MMPRRPDEEEAEQFAHAGWVVCEGIFDSVRMAELAELSLQLANDDLASAVTKLAGEKLHYIPRAPHSPSDSAQQACTA
jgi:hypothetical protein